MATYNLAVHGTAFVPELMAGDLGADGPLTQVENVPQSDIIGLHRGWGVIFRGKRDHRNWFHVALPSLPRIDQSAASLQAVGVQLTVAQSAVVEDVHLWSGGTQIMTFGRLALTGNFSRELGNVSLPASSLGISVHVAFGATDSSITFHAASARFAVA